MRHSHFPDRLQAPQLTLKLSPEDELRDGGLGEEREVERWWVERWIVRR
jgi:hypothetical protein